MPKKKRGVAVVTGAASGIGRATALRLAEDGWDIGLLDRRPGDADLMDSIEGYGRAAQFVSANVADPLEVATAMRTIVATLGPIDALVNNAGTIVDSAPAVEQTWDQWTNIMHVNAGGAFLCSREVLPGMLERGKGAIVNIASISGLVGIPGQSAYCMSKGAILQLTRSLTADYAFKGVRTNAICPGSIETPLLEKATEQDPTLLTRLEAGHPIGRLGTAIEIADVVAFLVSERASFIAGAIVSADGGYVAV